MAHFYATRSMLPRASAVALVAVAAALLLPPTWVPDWAPATAASFCAFVGARAALAALLPRLAPERFGALPLQERHALCSRLVSTVYDLVSVPLAWHLVLTPALLADPLHAPMPYLQRAVLTPLTVGFYLYDLMLMLSPFTSLSGTDWAAHVLHHTAVLCCVPVGLHHGKHALSAAYLTLTGCTTPLLHGMGFLRAAGLEASRAYACVGVTFVALYVLLRGFGLLCVCGLVGRALLTELAAPASSAWWPLPAGSGGGWATLIAREGGGAVVAGGVLLALFLAINLVWTAHAVRSLLRAVAKRRGGGGSVGGGGSEQRPMAFAIALGLVEERHALARVAAHTWFALAGLLHMATELGAPLGLQPPWCPAPTATVLLFAAYHAVDLPRKLLHRLWSDAAHHGLTVAVIGCYYAFLPSPLVAAFEATFAAGVSNCINAPGFDAVKLAARWRAPAAAQRRAIDATIALTCARYAVHACVLALQLAGPRAYAKLGYGVAHPVQWPSLAINLYFMLWFDPYCIAWLRGQRRKARVDATDAASLTSRGFCLLPTPPALHCVSRGASAYVASARRERVRRQRRGRRPDRRARCVRRAVPARPGGQHQRGRRTRGVRLQRRPRGV